MDEFARQYVELRASWLEQLECVFSYFSPCFGRIDRQRHAWALFAKVHYTNVPPTILISVKRTNAGHRLHTIASTAHDMNNLKKYFYWIF